MTHSRRTLLRAAAAAALAVPGGLIAVGSAQAAPHAESTAPGAGQHLRGGDDVFARMRQQWRAELVADGYDPDDPELAPVLKALSDDARQAWSTMDRGAGRTFLWADEVLEVQQSFAVFNSFLRLRQMALAWASPGAAQHGDAALLADTIAGLDWMASHYYRPDGPAVGNWYEWEISGPRAFNDAVVLLYDQLTPDQLAAYGAAERHYIGNVKFTAANRALTADSVIGRAVLTGDEAALTTATTALREVFTDVRAGDGFYVDGSFVQHSFFPYTGAYGQLLLSALPAVMNRLHGTPWQIDAPIVYEWLHEAFEPLAWGGASMEMVAGRTVSRHSESDHFRGHGTTVGALRLAASAPEDERPRLLAMVKEWLVSDPLDDPLEGQSIPLRLAARQLVQDTGVTRRGPLVTSRVYGSMDRVVHHREGWALGIAMHSARIATYESINAENLRGWTTADGMVYLHDDDLGHYTDGYWPTVDLHRLPGTTVDVRERADKEGASYRSPDDWAGGVTLGGRYTAAGMALTAQGSSLTARKAWFCFDREVVALGCGITASDGRRVETIIENRANKQVSRQANRAVGRKLSADDSERLLADGAPVVPKPGDRAAAHPRWLHLAGTGGYVLGDPDAGIGLFGAARPVQLLRETRTGLWTDINKHPEMVDTTPVTRSYLTAWLDHGTDPQGEGYAYVQLPGASAADTARYAALPDIAVVANATTVQAVRHLPLGLLGATFWSAGTASIVTVRDPAAVMVREDGDELTVTAADPTQRATRLRITVGVAATEVIEAESGVQVTGLDPVTLEVDVTGAAGASRTVRLRRTPWRLADLRALLASCRAAGDLDAVPYLALTALAGGGRVDVARLTAFRRKLAAERGKGVDAAAYGQLEDAAQRLLAGART